MFSDDWLCTLLCVSSSKSAFKVPSKDNRKGIKRQTTPDYLREREREREGGSEWERENELSVRIFLVFGIPAFISIFCNHSLFEQRDIISMQFSTATGAT
jgi:hypothetical protein